MRPLFKIIFLVLLACLSFFLFKKNDKQASTEVAMQAKNSIFIENSPGKPSGGFQSFSSSSVAIEKAHLTDNEIFKIENWRRDHGYFTAAELEDYKTYDIESLKKLARAGDLKALELVARYHMFRGEDAYSDFHYAAMHGSTHAFVAISYLIENKFLEDVSEEEKIKYSIDALAFLTVAGKRGDIEASTDDLASYKRRRNFHPTQEQQQAIDEKANKIYAEIEAQRRGMGLPDFDNSASPDIGKMIEINRVKK